MPLETLSGWPQVQNPTVLQSLLLFVGFPVLVFLIVIAINKITQTIHAARGDDPRTSDPLWVGDHEPARRGLRRRTRGPKPGNRLWWVAARSKAMTLANT